MSLIRLHLALYSWYDEGPRVESGCTFQERGLSTHAGAHAGRRNSRLGAMADHTYFSESEEAAPVRDVEEIGPGFWAGFVGLIRAKLNDGSFAETFPLPCFDTPLPMDCDGRALAGMFTAEVPGVPWPLDPDRAPATLIALDAVEFFARHISRVVSRSAHTSRSLGYQHDHLIGFDRDAGRADYLGTINALFRRCRHPYEIGPDHRIVRLGPSVLRETILRAMFRTGDAELDRLLNTARDRFMNPDAIVRLEAMERLWDAWERLKTIIPGTKDKTVPQLVEEAVPEPRLRDRVEAEAKALTAIGNDFMIRHHETDKPRIERPDQVDYLFYRMFALVYLLLRARQGIGAE